MKTPLLASSLIALAGLCACATGQRDAGIDALKPTDAACADAKQLKAADLYGPWHARFGAAAGTDEADVTFEPHQETDGALSGRILRPGNAAGQTKVSVLAGGIADGEFGIEESDDGRRISGLWNGSVVPGSCGNEIHGTWIDPLDDSERGFVLKRRNAAAR